MNSLGVRLAPEAVVAEMARFMRADATRRYKVTIGTDSELTHRKTADFVTAIVIHRVGNGGRYFWRRVEVLKRFHTLRDRIVEEVLISLDVARALMETVRAQPEMPLFDFEIHVDIGENGETRTMLQEIVGMVRAHHFEAKTKPESYAASSVADKHV